MPRKSSEPKSYLPAESGGVVPAPAKRKRTTRAKSAAKAQPAEVTMETGTVTDGPEKAFAAGSGGASAHICEREEVARLAYLYWEARQGQGGSAEEDWLRAEEEVRSRRENGR